MTRARPRLLVLAIALVFALAPPALLAQSKAPPKAAPAVPTAAPGPAAQPVPSAERIDTLKRIRDTGALVVGVREASVPFSFLDAQKQPQGYSVDICLQIAEAIKSELRMPRLEVKYVPVSSANRIPAVPLNQFLKEAFAAPDTYPAWP
jgi:glutamate/aspartate transport system substrate-binding protein